MPITVVQGGAFPNPYPHMNDEQRTAAQDVIAQLDYADLFAGQGTLRQVPLMRVDMQTVIPGPPRRSNIQVQVNGVDGHSTVAHADFDRTLATNNLENQRGALNKVISALNRSLDDGHTWFVAGNNP